MKEGAGAVLLFHFFIFLWLLMRMPRVVSVAWMPLSV